MQQLELFEHSDATDCSIDIETLDITPDSVVLSIGAVFFDKTGTYEELYWELDIQNQIAQGRTISERTLCWWMQQSPAARRVFDKRDKPTLPQALMELSTHYKAHAAVTRVWAKGPSFDLIILGHAYHQFNCTPPWRYSHHRDIRTLQDLAECCNIPLQKPAETSHNALDDAKAQAALVRQFYESTARR